MNAIIVCLLSLFVISCLGKSNESWRSEIVLSAKKVSRPLNGEFFGIHLGNYIDHVGIVVITKGGSYLIHNTEDLVREDRKIPNLWYGGKPGTVVVRWKIEDNPNWNSEDIPVKKKLTVQQVLNAMWGGNFKRPIGDGTYGLLRHNCRYAARMGKNALSDECVDSNDLRYDGMCSKKNMKTYN